MPWGITLLLVTPQFADAEHALKIVAVAEAAEKIWTRAKDARKLHAAIKAKLHNQAAYAVWRQSVAVPSQIRGIGRGTKRISELQSALPAADPGAVVVHRWRERLCAKIKEQVKFVTWDATVGIRYRPPGGVVAEHGLQAKLAKDDTGIGKQQVSHWRKALRDMVRHRARSPITGQKLMPQGITYP